MPNCAPWYREDYERIRSIIDDGEKLPTVSLVTGNIYGADRAMSGERSAAEPPPVDRDRPTRAG